MKNATQYTVDDNVATCLEPVKAGDTVRTQYKSVRAVENIPVYHKLAVCALEMSEPVKKYGEIIGMATAAIPAGAHVHIHNMESQRGSGDRK